MQLKSGGLSAMFIKSWLIKPSSNIFILFHSRILVLIISPGCYLFVRVRQSNLDHPLRQGSWHMKSYHMLSFTEKDIIDAIKSENLIDYGNRRSYQSTAVLLTERNFWSLEYDAEVAALSAIRHVNVVKLYCSIQLELMATWLRSRLDEVSYRKKAGRARICREQGHSFLRNKVSALRPSMRTIAQMLEEAEPCKLSDIIVLKNGENRPNGSWKNSGKLI
ncbi:hypothetical protein QQP08_005366 [Theobroma cacao]|nr:hypothetical protein QQP08_005366 [Theobroma cacao]